MHPRGTSNRLIRSQVLYPVDKGAHHYTETGPNRRYHRRILSCALPVPPPPASANDGFERDPTLASGGVLPLNYSI